MQTHGIRLPMASTILRFKNPHVYQIIDQRVYRLLYKAELKLKSQPVQDIQLYLDYLKKLKETCEQFDIPFINADRLLYAYDKKVNSAALRGYGSKTKKNEVD